MAVRKERVILELEDQFSGPMARATAATKVFERSLGDLDNTVVRTDRDSTSLGDPNGPIGSMGRQAGSSSREIDRFSGRLRLLADTAAILGPALIPIGAVAIPAVTGLAAQFGAAALAGGTAIIAFQGVGDALEAVNTAALEPSTKNLEAARIAMQNLAPEAAAFVRQLQDMRPAFDALQNAAAAGLFPGLSTALSGAEGAFGRVEGILYAVGDAAGDVAAEFAEGIAGPRGQEFLAFLEAEVPSALVELGRTVGNVASGLAELWMAFTPLNNSFSSWLLDASRSFDQWADGLSRTEGFREFITYVRENGPRVADAMGSIGNALLQIVEAAAPMGGPVLAALAAVADVIAAIADSPAGPAIMATVTAMALLNRGMATFEAVKAAPLFDALSGSADRANRSMSALAKGGIVLAGASVASMLSDLGDVDYTFDQINRQLGVMASQGSSADVFENLSFSAENLGEALRDAAFNDFNVFGLGAADEIKELDTALAGLDPSEAAAAFEAISREGREAGLSTAEVTALFPQYQAELRLAAKETEAFGAAGAAAGAAAGRGFRQATSAAQSFRTAVERANAVLEGRATVRDYQQALDDLRKSVRENGRTLDVNTQKGRDNQAALDAIAQTTIRVAENMRGTNRVNFLNQARRDFVDAAKKMGIGQARARDLWAQLTQLDGVRANPKVDVDTGAAAGAIAGINAALNGIDDETVYVNVVRRGVAGGVAAGVVARADGGTIYGDRTPYRDKVLAHLAPGEEVISNRYGQADRNRALLKAINANRYANGGTVGQRAASVNVGSPNINVTAPNLSDRDIARLAKAVESGAYAGTQGVPGVVDDRIGAHRASASARSAAVYSGVSDD